jgi:hypothetical protein
LTRLELFYDFLKVKNSQVRYSHETIYANPIGGETSYR